eukprot:COSAG01_NODE_4274_length_5190_cov_1.718916_2_plen_76_part_00
MRIALYSCGVQGRPAPTLGSKSPAEHAPDLPTSVTCPPKQLGMLGALPMMMQAWLANWTKRIQGRCCLLLRPDRQ